MTSEYAISEFSFNVQQRDSIKARLVLADIEEYQQDVRRRLLLELSKTEDSFAILILCSLFQNHPDLFRLYPGLENIFLSKARDNPEFILGHLAPDTADLRGYVWVAGRLGLQSAVPYLEDLLFRVRDPFSITCIIEALGEIGTVNNSKVLAEFLLMDDKRIAEAAVRSLSRIGTPSSLDYLFAVLGRDEQLDFIVLETFVEIANEQILERLNRLLTSRSAFLRNQAADKLSRIGDRAVPCLLQNIKSADPDLVIQSLNILARIGDDSAVRPIMKLISSYPEDPNVRFAAYEALGSLPVEKSAYMLARGFLDPEENVRLAVARAVDHNYNSGLGSGISNMLRDRDMAPRIVHALVNAQAAQAFLGLLHESTFWDLARNYINHRAHPQVRDFFLNLLQDQGRSEAASSLKSGREESPVYRPRIFCVDDSRMVLEAYRSTLYELGFDPVLFDSPQQALDWLQEEKPDLLFTDLNMPELDGGEFIKNIREFYSREDLCVVLVTSQGEEGGSEQVHEAGADEILIKPFSSRDLQDILSRFLGKYKN
ncbi:MAG: HEAT repeat domain-containing protein [Thermodesulfobacteriota bacterium]